MRVKKCWGGEESKTATELRYTGEAQICTDTTDLMTRVNPCFIRVAQLRGGFLMCQIPGPRRWFAAAVEAVEDRHQVAR